VDGGYIAWLYSSHDQGKARRVVTGSAHADSDDESESELWMCLATGDQADKEGDFILSQSDY
jgi:hypothetical protein